MGPAAVLRRLVPGIATVDAGDIRCNPRSEATVATEASTKVASRTPSS
jgi:hypothetical protein